MKLLIELTTTKDQVVFDPFCGSGTTLKVGLEKGYDVIGCDVDLNAISICKKRLEVNKK